MSTNAVVINNQEVQMIMYKNQAVVTFEMVDTLHERPEGTAKRNFSENRSHLIQDEDYFNLPYREWQSIVTVVRNSYHGHNKRGHYGKRIFLTESGYLMLVKSFNDDLAWRVQRELVNRYFRIREHLQECLEACVKASVEASLKACQAMLAGVFSQSEGKTVNATNAISRCYGLQDFEFLAAIGRSRHPEAKDIVVRPSGPIGVSVGNKFFTPERIEYTLESLTRILRALIRANDPALAGPVFNRLRIPGKNEDFHIWGTKHVLWRFVNNWVPKVPGLNEFVEAYGKLKNKAELTDKEAKEISLEQILPPRFTKLTATKMLFATEDHPEIARGILAQEDPKQAAIDFLIQTGTDPKDMYVWIAMYLSQPSVPKYEGSEAC